MKMAMFLDKFLGKYVEGSNIRRNKSYYYKDNKTFFLEDNMPTEENYTITSPYYSYVDLFQGTFIDLSQYTEIPIIDDLDVIFLTLEWHIHRIEEIRKAYPDTFICAIIKELYHISSFEDRIKFFNSCDAILHQYHSLYFPDNFLSKNPIRKRVYFFPCPIDVNRYKERFYKHNKKDAILLYLPLQPERQGNTCKFTCELSEKYKIPYVTVNSNDRTEFFDITSRYKYCFNLDPEPQLGQQSIVNAIVKTLNFGGLNDANIELFPKTATLDEKIIENEFKMCLDYPDYYTQQVNFAHKKVVETYSYEAVMKNFNNILTNEKNNILK